MTPKEKFLRLIYLALQKYGIIPKNQLHYLKLSQKFNLCLLYTRIENVPGCVVECGVAKGQSLAALKILSIAEAKNRKVYGFDTFSGLPEPASFEGGCHQGQFFNTKGAVQQHFKDTAVPMDDVFLIEGDVRDSLKTFNEPIAFLHIDLDLYEGHKAALSYLWDKLSTKGIVVFDDYRNKSWTGATRAVDEFVKEQHITLNKAKFANKFYLVK